MWQKCTGNSEDPTASIIRAVKFTVFNYVTYVTNQQMRTEKIMFYHILLFTNMFWSLM